MRARRAIELRGTAATAAAGVTALPPQGQGQGAVPGYPPGLENPNQMSPPSFPQGQGNGNLERAQLMQTGESGDESFAFLSGNNVGSSDYLQGPGGLGGMTGNGGAMMPSPFQQLPKR